MATKVTLCDLFGLQAQHAMVAMVICGAYWYFVISANAPPANFINYRFFSISCLLPISKRFGLSELLQYACKMVIAAANNVRAYCVD